MLWLLVNNGFALAHPPPFGLHGNHTHPLNSIAHIALDVMHIINNTRWLLMLCMRLISVHIKVTSLCTHS